MGDNCNVKFDGGDPAGGLFATFIEGAGEIVQMLAYFEAYTYLEPDLRSGFSLQGKWQVAISSP
jgi:hypothetical protein